MTQTNSIDLDLVDQVIALVPDQAWTHLRQVIVTTLVDNMPGSVLQRLTGTYDDFDQAEKILLDYYKIPSMQKELIVDLFKIMGSVDALEFLNSVQLETFLDNEMCTM
jgi:hypothetical protein